MVSMFYLPEKELLVTGNPRVYRSLLAAYRTFAPLRGESVDYLTISRPERVNIKTPNSSHELAHHMDLNIFSSTGGMDCFVPGTRIQGMQIVTIPEWNQNIPNGTLLVVKRFHLYAAIASQALHPVTGVEGMRQKRDFSQHPLHYFTPLTLPLAALSLYIRFIEAFVQLPGGAQLSSLPVLGEVARVSVVRIRAHAQAIAQSLGLEGCYPNEDLRVPLTTPLSWQPVSEARSGSLVLWDSLIPHANLSNMHPTQFRVVAYVDFAPRDRPNSLQQSDRIALMQTLSPGGTRGVAAKNDCEVYLAAGKWKKLADNRHNSSNTSTNTPGSLLWTSDGQYGHVRSEGRLLAAMYGYDPTSHKRFRWSDYEELDAQMP
eukprot:c7462_g1_i1.p1 GENE.c7462_g1_i1~~c7462_g1_i1.p1  ORF type:complete len:373 (+),score=73.87 c7462_g1_i1:434-1552(+)